MATELKDYIRTYDAVMSRSECQEIIKAFDLNLQHQEYIDSEKRPSFTQMNITKRYIDRDEKFIPIQEKTQKVFIDYVSLYMKQLDIGADFPDKYAFEEFRLKKYNERIDEFKDHVDVGDYNSARRFLVCFLYLNDIPEGNGGETSFPKLDLKIQPIAGRLLIFPPTWQYRHAGLPVKSGRKYILGTYLHYL